MPTSWEPVAACFCKPATRTMKNSSRLELTMEINFTLSSSGFSRVFGFLQNSSLEFQQAELAVYEQLGIIQVLPRGSSGRFACRRSCLPLGFHLIRLTKSARRHSAHRNRFEVSGQMKAS